MRVTAPGHLRNSTLIGVNQNRRQYNLLLQSEISAQRTQKVGMNSSSPARRPTVTAVVVAVLALASPLAAHDVPPNVVVQLLVRPQGDHLQVLLRAPLEALQETLFPTTGPGYLDMAALESSDVLSQTARSWLLDGLEIYESGRRLPPARISAIRISLPSNRSFGSFDGALEHIRGPALASGTQLLWRQAVLDTLIEIPIETESSRFSIRPQHARLGQRVTTVLRFWPPGRGVRAFEYTGNPGLVQLDPRWHQAALHFVGRGFRHILSGLDHLLFLLCLVVPMRRPKDLVIVATSFTVAHSITLLAAASGLAPSALWFPPLVEALIAASIVYMALENILEPRLERRWIFAFVFGLVHGFGFSFALQNTLQFAGSHLLTSLLAFNVGVELGQLLVLLILVPTLAVVLGRLVPERPGTIVISALVAHTAWHWLTERGSDLQAYRVQMAGLPAFPASAALWLLGTVLLAFLLVRAVMAKRPARKPVSAA